MQKPKGEGRCIHCGQPLLEETDDHVFPTSWYPDSTPQSVQRWKAPSCRVCNGNSGKKEQELFIRLALCINPRKNGALGISAKLARTFGIGEGISPADRQKRIAFRAEYSLKRSRFPKKIRPTLSQGSDLIPAFPSSRNAKSGFLLTSSTMLRRRSCAVVSFGSQVAALLTPLRTRCGSVDILVTVRDLSSRRKGAESVL